MKTATPPSREDFERAVAKIRETFPRLRAERTEEIVDDETHYLCSFAVGDEEVVVGWTPCEMFVSTTDTTEDLVTTEWERLAGEALRRLRLSGETLRQETEAAPPSIASTVELDGEVRALLALVQGRWAERYGADADLSTEALVRFAVMGLFGSAVLAPLGGVVAEAARPTAPRRGAVSERQRRASIRTALETALERLARELPVGAEMLLSAHYAPLRRMLPRNVRTNELAQHLTTITRGAALEVNGLRFRLERAGEQYFHGNSGDTFMTWALTRLN